MDKKLTVTPQINEEWLNELTDEFQKNYFLELKKFLLAEKQKHVIYPPGRYIFNAFNLTPFSKVKVVIIGQDPYHGKGQAHGLCFSVPDGVAIPPSLQNIYKELYSDLGIPVPATGNLTSWATQGVLLLNAILTVRAGQPGSHRGKGWERFTDTVIQKLNNQKENLVFLLWGKFAQEKGAMIDESKHLILKAPHPSPFSANRGFFGCKHFSKTNNYLQEKGITPINWKIE